ncbi:MAG: hypothetical protein MJ231_05695 [bacterium]|nr:hypothetical protein [bacterium]
MKIRNLLKLLILFLTVTACTVKTYAEDAEQIILLSVPATIAVSETDFFDSTSINPATGIMEQPMYIKYSITTNGTDDDYDFTLRSQITDGSGSVSAFGNNGAILFAHVLNPPTTTDVENAKQGNDMNSNVIAYPTSASITSPMTATYTPNFKSFGDCYVIKTNDGDSAELTFTIQASPIPGTYNAGQDEEGTYKTTIMVTATPKS